MNTKINLTDIKDIENFVIKNKDFLSESDWKKISQNQNITENFIRIFEDKVDWFLITINCIKNFSEDFLLEFKHKIYWSQTKYIKGLTFSKDFTYRFNTVQKSSK